MICSKCKLDKEATEFFFKDKKKNTRRSQCKLCEKERRTKTWKAHYLKYKDDYLRRSREGKKKYVQGKWYKLLILDRKKDGCIICGEKHPACLDFHHIDPNTKKFDIGSGLRSNKPKQLIEEEIKKCILICSNCHRKKTAEKNHWYSNLSPISQDGKASACNPDSGSSNLS